MSANPQRPDLDVPRDRPSEHTGAPTEGQAAGSAPGSLFASPGSLLAAPGSLFASPAPGRKPARLLPWGIAGLTVLALLSGLLLMSSKGPSAHGNALLPIDPYASSVAVADLKMSESTSLSGGKSTFIDGRVRNDGQRTITAATVQVLFANDMGMPPQVETLPLTVIRTRSPYVDTQALSAAPLNPKEDREFRLIFENIGSNWNQQLPEIHLVRVSVR